MSDPVQTRSRHIRFSSTVSESFIVRKELSESLVKLAEGYWREKGMAVKKVPPHDGHSEGQSFVEFSAEGGTIWTTNFDSYRKTVTVSLRRAEANTEVIVHIVLPGGIMSLQDRERAADLIESFYRAMDS